jgi:hypothetical protein
MKIKGTFLAIAIAAFSTAAPAQQHYSATSTAIVQKQKLQVVTPFNFWHQPAPKSKIERVGGMSSQPWTQIAGWPPGASAFPDAETHESTLYIFSIGHEPWR